LHGNVIFVVGAPRSGTTWLHQLLAVHPDVVTAGEAHAFCCGLDSVIANFADPDPYMKLSTWVDEGELLTAARAMCDSIFDAMRAGSRPTAARVLDKTPNHRQQAALQARLYPDATYIHIIRDGRDASASTHALWKRLADEYASATQAAAGWADAVRDVRANLRGLRYMEIRYEDLLADVEGGLATIFDHAGLPHDAEFRRAVAEFGAAPINVAPGSAAVGARKHAGNVLVERAVARVAGDLMVELGYLDAGEVGPLARRRSRDTVVADALGAVRRIGQQPARLRASLTNRYRRSRWRSGTADARRIAEEVRASIEDKDDTRLQAVLAPNVDARGFDGAATHDVATAVIAKVGGWRSVATRAEPGGAVVTFVDSTGGRVLLRVGVQGGRVAAIELL
jgi:LPS sulfotransferase NodH